MEEKLWTRSYILALIMMFGIYMVSSILLSVMAIHAKNLSGLDTYAGLMVTTFTIGALAVRFLAGGLIDRFGSKSVIIFGVLVLILGSVWLLFSNGINQVLIARALQGAGFGLSATATSTYIAIICHPDHLLEGISYTAVAQSLTAVIGPSVGFWLIGPSYNRFTVLFLVAIGIGFSTFLLVLFEKNNHGKKVTNAPGELASEPVPWRLTVLPLMILLMNSLTQSGIISFLALYAISLSIAGIGSFFSINALGMITSRFIMNKLVRRYGQFQMVLFNTVIFAICVFFITQATHLSHLLIIAFPAGFAMGSISPIINTKVLQTMPHHKKGLANALYFATLDIGYGAGSVLWGIIAMNYGYLQIFYLAALLQGIAIVITLMQLQHMHKAHVKIMQTS